MCDAYVKFLLGVLDPRNLQVFDLLLELKLTKPVPQGVQLVLPLSEAGPEVCSLVLEEGGKSLLGMPNCVLLGSFG
jgi:hypothetical protein